MEVVERLRAKAREAREALVSKRAILEKDVIQFAENIKLVDPKLIQHIHIPEGGITPRNVFPSLYVEPVDVDQYKREEEAFAVLLTEFDKVRAGLIQRAEAMMNG